MLRLKRPVLERHRSTLRRVSHLHRLYQVSLGILAAQHPDVVEACGHPVRWSALYRPGGGLGLSGPRASWSVVPGIEGSWSPAGAPAAVVRAVDETIDAMCRTVEPALASARAGRDGNQLARGFYYMQKGLVESEFVTQYIQFMRQPKLPDPLTDLFGDRLRG